MWAPTDIEAAFADVTEHWSPKVIGRVNDQLLKVAKLKGEFVWHDHAGEDELFWIVKGRLRIEFEDGAAQIVEETIDGVAFIKKTEGNSTIWDAEGKVIGPVHGVGNPGEAVLQRRGFLGVLTLLATEVIERVEFEYLHLQIPGDGMVHTGNAAVVRLPLALDLAEMLVEEFHLREDRLARRFYAHLESLFHQSYS